MSPVDIEEAEGVVTARLEGEIDMANARDIGARIVAAIPNSTLGVVLDLSGTTYLDSAGIQVIFDLAERLSSRQQQFRVAVPEGARVRRVLDIVRLEGTVPIDVSADDAETEIRSKA
jgi:anti-anti-sigma factor